MHKFDIKAEIGGVVFKVEVAEGAHVERGDIVLVIESMKMEITVECPCSGIIDSVTVKEGDVVHEDQVLARVSAH